MTNTVEFQADMLVDKWIGLPVSYIEGEVFQVLNGEGVTDENVEDIEEYVEYFEDVLLGAKNYGEEIDHNQLAIISQIKVAIQRWKDATKLALADSNRHLYGEYKETEIDKKKAVSNRLVSICGKYRTVITADGEQLEFVGVRQWDKWAKENDYVTDF